MRAGRPSAAVTSDNEKPLTAALCLALGSFQAIVTGQSLDLPREIEHMRAHAGWLVCARVCVCVSECESEYECVCESVCEFECGCECACVCVCGVSVSVSLPTSVRICIHIHL